MRKTTRRIFFGFTMLCFSMITVAQVRPQTGDSTRSTGPGGPGGRPAAGVRPYKEGEAQAIEVSTSFKWTIGLVAALVILLGVYPQLLFSWFYF